MAEIKKSFNGNDVPECGTVNYCSWERLEPYLRQAAGLNANEYISGIHADADGIKIFIETKPATG